MSVFKSILRLFRDTFHVLRRDGKLLYLPLFFIIVLLTGIMIFISISGPLAPFIYPLI